MPWLQTNVYNGFTENMSQDDASRADDLTINVWPITTDSLDWSPDADIVVAAGDDLQLLIPKLRITEDKVDGDTWELIRLRASFFTQDEMPQEEPASFATWSLGEEISTGDVVRARWTGAGVARHGRCGLLVLTQNLLLSLWAPEKMPRYGEDWQRRGIVNREVQRYFEGLDPGLVQRDGEDKTEELKRMVRGRSFAVARPMIEKGLDESCLVAVANDCDQVIIVRMKGPKSEEDATTMTAETHFAIADEKVQQPALDWTFEDYMKNTRFAQHLAWSPWVIGEHDTMRALLACATQSHLMFRWIVLGPNGRISTEEYQGQVRLRKPWSSDVLLEWLPHLQDQRYGKLVACTNDRTFVFTVDLQGDEQLRSSKIISDQWAQVAGMLHLRTEDGHDLLQTLPHVTNEENCLTSMELQQDRLVVPNDSPANGLQDAIRFNRSQFDSKFKTKGNVMTRLWGLALSPLQDLAATSATFHPSNSPEYIIPADMSSRVIFQSTGREDFISNAIHRGASTEAIAFSTKCLVKNLKSQPEKKQAMWRILDHFEKAMSSMPIAEPDINTSTFKDLLFSSHGLTGLRFERLMSMIMGQAEATLEGEKQIVEQIARWALNIPASRYRDTSKSRLMLAHFRRILVLFNLASEDSYLKETETCEICSAEIAFDDHASARCSNGHNLREPCCPKGHHLHHKVANNKTGRCALTFLAIQAPGLCKSCGICGKQYLKTSHVEGETGSSHDVEMGGTTSNIDQSRSLTELFSIACDKCVYCGGKFVG